MSLIWLVVLAYGLRLYAELWSTDLQSAESSVQCLARGVGHMGASIVWMCMHSTLNGCEKWLIRLIHKQ